MTDENEKEEVTIKERFLPAFVLFIFGFGIIVVLQLFINRPILCFGIGLAGIFAFKVSLLINKIKLIFIKKYQKLKSPSS